MEKSGKLKKGLLKILSHLHPNELLLRTFPEAGVNSSSFCRIEYGTQQYRKSVFLAGETNYGLAVGSWGKRQKVLVLHTRELKAKLNHEKNVSEIKFSFKQNSI